MRACRRSQNHSRAAAGLPRAAPPNADLHAPERPNHVRVRPCLSVWVCVCSYRSVRAHPNRSTHRRTHALSHPNLNFIRHHHSPSRQTHGSARTKTDLEPRQPSPEPFNRRRTQPTSSQHAKCRCIKTRASHALHRGKKPGAQPLQPLGKRPGPLASGKSRRKLIHYTRRFTNVKLNSY